VSDEERRIHRNTLLEHAAAGWYALDLRRALQPTGRRELVDELERLERSPDISHVVSSWSPPPRNPRAPALTVPNLRASHEGARPLHSIWNQFRKSTSRSRIQPFRVQPSESEPSCDGSRLVEGEHEFELAGFPADRPLPPSFALQAG
jgi:hypothetical protein